MIANDSIALDPFVQWCSSMINGHLPSLIKAYCNKGSQCQTRFTPSLGLIKYAGGQEQKEFRNNRVNFNYATLSIYLI